MKLADIAKYPLVEIGAGLAPGSAVHPLAEAGDNLAAIICAGAAMAAVIHGVLRFDYPSNAENPEITPALVSTTDNDS